jgi:hypothetical protein
MGLDIYTWLAQRLYRIDARRPALIPWPALKEQFGSEYQRLDHFRPPFRKALAQVQQRYQTACIEHDKRGLTAPDQPASGACSQSPAAAKKAGFFHATFLGGRSLCGKSAVTLREIWSKKMRLLCKTILQIITDRLIR